MSPYTYNSSNELTSTPAATFTYDNNGNTLTKVVSGGTTTYNWDFNNRLTSAVLPGSGGTVTFKYDPFGRRVQENSSSGVTNYLYDGANVIEEVDASGNLVARYSQGMGVDEPLAEFRSGTTSYYQQDGLSSVTSISNSAGILANTYTYDAFGNLTASTGALINPFQYTGRDYDPETGLRYYRARYYDSSTGRFLSEDPITFDSGTTNFYAYADDNPVNFTDPDGRKAEVCCRLSLYPGLRQAGMKHCYVKITPVKGKPQTYGLHGEEDTPPHKKFPEGARPRVGDMTDVDGTCEDVKDSTPCKEREFMRKAMADVDCPSCKDKYFPTSTNSNYWVWNALKNAGMTPPAFPNEWGLVGYGDIPPPEGQQHGWVK
jgi:RHS repeat-associated protein